MSEIVQKKKSEFSKGVIILDISLFITYVAFSAIMQWHKGFTLPPDINLAVFTFLGAELGLLALIKKAKIKTGEPADQ